jgi:hypothetical protein
LYKNTTARDNSAFGKKALFDNITGDYNTAAGVGALMSNTTANNNAAFGNSALVYNTTGAQNTAIGSSSLYTNTTGSNNSAVGKSALERNTTGYNNVAVGRDALYWNTTGPGNSALGVNALRANTAGTNNASIGENSMYVNTTGSGNAALGQSALMNNTSSSNNSAVGHKALKFSTGGNNTGVGFNAGQNITTGSNNIVIGANTNVYGIAYDDQLHIGEHIERRNASNYVVSNKGFAVTQRLYYGSGSTTILLFPQHSSGSWFCGTLVGDNYDGPAMYELYIHDKYNNTSSVNFSGNRKFGATSYIKKVTYSGTDYIAFTFTGHVNRGWTFEGIARGAFSPVMVADSACTFVSTYYTL